MHRRVKCPFPDCFTNSTDNETTNEDGNKTEESVKEDLSVESERSNSPQTGMFGIAAVDLPRHLRYECTSAIRKRR